MTAVGVVTILMAAVVAVLVTSTESFAEVIIVLALIHIIAVVAIVGILIGIAVLITVAPTVLAVCLPCAKARCIAVIYGLTEQIRTILIYLIVPAATIVAIVRSRREVRVSRVIVSVRVLEAYLLLAQASKVLLLITVLRQPSLSL